MAPGRPGLQRTKTLMKPEIITKKNIAIAALVLLFFGFGIFVGNKWKWDHTSFHDIIVHDAEDLQALVTPDDKQVARLAADLQSPEQAFEYVRDRIIYDDSLPAMPAASVINYGKASCLGKAILLCSLYRAMGLPASDVRIATGELAHPGTAIFHAWVDIEYEGVCYQQDATNLIGTFGFYEFKGASFTHSFIRREEFVFNDVDFAVVSPLNLTNKRISQAAGSPRD